MEVIYLIMLAVGAAVGAAIGYFYQKNADRQAAEGILSSAEAQKRQMIEKAQTEAQAKVEEAEKRAREIKEKESVIRKNTEREAKKRKHELDKLEAQLLSKIEKNEARSDLLEKRADAMKAKEDAIEKLKQEKEKVLEEQKRKLEQVAGLSPEQAREQLLKRVEEELQYEIAVKIKEAENRVKDAADKKSRDILATSIQRCSTDHSIDPIVTVVELPSEEMKGRIIGREGRNIRSFEAITGVDVIIDDTPEAVVLSSFDPIKRAIARTTLDMLT
ncbi:MAG TPA: Rnase Y domain-containing protein, partial [Candidatus Ozemobacteraceae bacterium]|nr:Rnase Y domain-containing protein [Candidatus Ozemobacteraceae bacterium]